MIRELQIYLTIKRRSPSTLYISIKNFFIDIFCNFLIYTKTHIKFKFIKINKNRNVNFRKLYKSIINHVRKLRKLYKWLINYGHKEMVEHDVGSISCARGVGYYHLKK